MRLTTKLLMAASALFLSAGQTSAPAAPLVFTYNSLGDFSKAPPYPLGCHPFKDYNGKGGEVSNGRIVCDNEPHYRQGNVLGKDLHADCKNQSEGYVCIVTKGVPPPQPSPEPQLPSGS